MHTGRLPFITVFHRTALARRSSSTTQPQTRNVYPNGMCVEDTSYSLVTGSIRPTDCQNCPLNLNSRALSQQGLWTWTFPV